MEAGEIKIGETYGSVTVKNYMGSDQWFCECECGRNTVLKSKHIYVAKVCKHADYSNPYEATKANLQAIEFAKTREEKKRFRLYKVKEKYGRVKAYEYGRRAYEMANIILTIYIKRAAYRQGISVSKLLEKCQISRANWEKILKYPLRPVSWVMAFKFITTSGYPFDIYELRYFYEKMLTEGHRLYLDRKLGFNGAPLREQQGWLMYDDFWDGPESNPVEGTEITFLNYDDVAEGWKPAPLPVSLDGSVAPPESE